MRLFIDSAAVDFLHGGGTTVDALLNTFRARRVTTLTKAGTALVTTPEALHRYVNSAVYTGHNNYGREFWLLYVHDGYLKIEVI